MTALHTRIDSAPSITASPRRVDGYLPIEDYAAIGDGRTLALVGIDGSIDWMCLPELDAPSVFARILSPADGGAFVLEPSVPYCVRRSYLRATNVLRTEFTTADGCVRVTDALTFDGSQVSWRELVRHVEGLSGVVPMRWSVRPRFEFGRRATRPRSVGGTEVFRHERLQLAFQAWGAGEPRPREGAIEGSFEIPAGERALLALLAGDEVALPCPSRDDLERRLDATAQAWREWVGRSSYDGAWKDDVDRSLLALGLLSDGRTGAIAAAATMGLPETIGGERNFDYRFAWIRDLSFTVDALLSAGMDDLAHAGVVWMLDAVARTHPRIDPVYALTGEVVRSQHELRLPGYRRTSPVRVGNAAGSQLQLGGFGDLLETLYLYVDAGHLLAPAAGDRMADCADLLCSIWTTQDAGLWELGSPAHYTTSKLGSWTCLRRVLHLVDRGQVPARHVARWQAERDRIREFIETRLWSDSRRSYVMKEGSELLDCGTLLGSRRGFGDPAGARMLQTIDAIRSELHAGGPLFYRYSGMQEEENAFLACSFWMVEALALAGRGDEAAVIMDEAVGLANDVGLFSEEMDPRSHGLKGNFPQALTHLSVIRAADVLGRRNERP